MNKEELEKEAENFIIDRYKLNECYREDNAETREYMRMDVHSQYEEEYQLYLAGAEPREKRIAELESTNKKISDECHKLVNTLEKKQNKNELLETQNIKLQAEVSRLTIKNAELRDNYEIFKAIAEPEIKSLKEENATLKESLDYANLTNAEFASDLTKAKEILQKVVTDFHNRDCVSVHIDKTIAKAEQFLKEN